MQILIKQSVLCIKNNFNLSILSKKLTYVSINFPSKPPFFDRVICCDKQCFPRTGNKYFFKKYLEGIKIIYL